MKWIIDRCLFDETPGEKLPDAVRALGHECWETKYIPFSDGIEGCPYQPGERVIPYGTHGFLAQCRNLGLDLFDCNEANFECSMYLPRIASGLLLNADYQFLPFGEITRRPFHPHFIRPNNGTKLFAGRAVREKEDLRKIAERTRPESICLVAPLQELSAEYRFFIVEGKVVTGSQYRYYGNPDIRRDWHSEAHALACYVAESTWQPDACYTCDVAMVNGQAKVIELNPFNCAGLYAADPMALVQAVSEAA